MIVAIIITCINVLVAVSFFMDLAWSKGYDDALEDMRKMLHDKNSFGIIYRRR